MQKFLTKYGLVFHIACACLLPVLFIGRPSAFGGVPLFWLSVIVAEWMFLLPSVRRGETLANARQRVGAALVWDPLFCLGIGMLVFVGIQGFNSGCALEYLPDTDVWKMGDPPVPWAPFSVKGDVALSTLSVFSACLLVIVALRNAVGKGGKHVLLQGLCVVSGMFALFGAGAAWFEVPSWMELVAGEPPSVAGTYFGFWLLVGMGLLAEVLEHGQRRGWILFLAGVFGNLVGLIFFAAPLPLVVYILCALLLFVYGLVYLGQHMKKSTLFKVFLCVVGCVAAMAAVLAYNSQNPVHEKIVSVFPLENQWDVLVSRNAVRVNAALSIWQEYVWRGCGSDGFFHFAGLVVPPENWKMVETDRACVYNDGVQFLCEYGVFGAGVLLAALITLLIPIFMRIRQLGPKAGEKGKRDPVSLWSPPLVGGILALLLCGLESMIASPFRSSAVLLAWSCVMAALPAFISEKTYE